MAAGPRLSENDREVVEHAARVLTTTLDRLGPDLMAAAGHFDWRLKSDGTPITASDQLAHDQLADAIGKAFPDHGILSEEGETLAGDQRWVWIIDPVDGTSNFTAGLPYWAVSVALTVEAHPVLAIVDAPALGQRYQAVRGRGALRNGAPLATVREVDWTTPAGGYVPLLMTPGLVRRASPRVRLNPRIMGSVALDLCAVAAGFAAATFHPKPRVWDVAAGWLVVEEAGGAVVTLDDEPLLPLTPRADYATRVGFTAAGPSAGYLHALADAIWS